MNNPPISSARQVPAGPVARLVLAAAVAAFGTFSVASAQSADRGATAAGKTTTVKKCSSSDYASGCIAGINSSVGNGVFGRNTSGGFGVEGQSESQYAGVAGYNDGSKGGYGVFARSLHGDALYAYSDTAIAVLAQSSEYGGTASIPLVAQSYGSTGASVILGEWGTNVVFNADISGNVSITGQLYSSGKCHTGCSSTRHVTSFGARSSEPTIDDVGEAMLRAGSTHVALDPSFANAIDATKPYVVMLTPEGDAGLYVTNRTASGFDVRQIGGGHANVSFAYRIVAKPYGVRDERLPFHVDPMVRQAPQKPAVL